MTSISLTKQTIFWSNETLRNALFVLAGVMLLATAAQISIPLLPVPVTLQSVTVLLIGIGFGPRYGVRVIAIYLLAGAIGLPIFSNFSGGLIKFFSPTGGYLMGFLPAAFLSGYLAQKGLTRSILGNFITCLLSISVIYLCGVSWLATQMGWQNAISVGLMPFIFIEPIKLLIMSLLLPLMWK
ncbi:MAG: hypothetical protein ACD_46C00089G0003 [uncultured bacterium]|nr:MAG: hypothetical protein ACD_46C00089G0003 [uncultured bacterium]